MSEYKANDPITGTTPPERLGRPVVEPETVEAEEPQAPPPPPPPVGNPGDK